MLVFDLLSSVFECLTFAVVWYAMHAATEKSRTGWFLESIVSGTLIVLIVRKGRPFFKSRPDVHLTAGMAAAIFLALS